MIDYPRIDQGILTRSSLLYNMPVVLTTFAFLGYDLHTGEGYCGAQALAVTSDL